jgi:hypothetical protein
MQYDWITKALEEGGVMTISKNKQRILAMMHLGDRGSVMGDAGDTLPEALTRLNIAIFEESDGEE